MIGKKAALPALIIGSAPFYARMVEIGLREIDKGVIEAARSMGAKTSTIIWKVLASGIHASYLYQVLL